MDDVALTTAAVPGPFDAAGLPAQVGPYRIAGLVGRGRIAGDHLAVDSRSGREVALKVLPAEWRRFPGACEEFLASARSMARLRHPNIVEVLDVGEDGDLRYVAMQYVRGPDLRAFLAGTGPLEPPEALYVLEQAAAALDFAHGEGVVHADLKPGNVLVEEASRHVYVSDFLAWAHFPDQFVGTLEYASPEQLSRLPPTPRSDVYSFGCLAFECLAGREPYPRKTDTETILAHLSDSAAAAVGRSRERARRRHRQGDGEGARRALRVVP